MTFIAGTRFRFPTVHLSHIVDPSYLADKLPGSVSPITKYGKSPV